MFYVVISRYCGREQLQKLCAGEYAAHNWARQFDAIGYQTGVVVVEYLTTNQVESRFDILDLQFFVAGV